MFDVSKYLTVRVFDEPEEYEKRKRWRKEKYLKEKKEQKDQIEKFILEYQYPYNHPIPKFVHRYIAKIEYVRTLQKYENDRTPHWSRWVMGEDEVELLGRTTFPDTSDPIYIIDKDLKIIDWEPTRNDARNWIVLKELWYKPIGRTTMYEYIKNRWLYKNQVYFVPVKEYEEFIEEKSKKVS